MATQFKDIVISTEYQSNGETKKKYTNIGTVFVYEDGGMSIKLDVVPVGWNGNASVYERKPRQQPQAQQQSYSQPQQQQVPEIDTGSIPF